MLVDMVYKIDKIQIICYNKVRFMEKKWVCCPHCNKKLFKIDEKSKYDNIYVWCKNCKKELIIKEPKSQSK